MNDSLTGTVSNDLGQSQNPQPVANQNLNVQQLTLQNSTDSSLLSDANSISVPQTLGASTQSKTTDSTETTAGYSMMPLAVGMAAVFVVLTVLAVLAIQRGNKHAEASR